MNICFKKVTLHNFLSFGDAEVNLDDSSYTLVSGINNCKSDLAKSNGSGKSSLWESIIWVLTGDTIRGTKDVVNRYGKDGTFVELIFNIDKNNYRIIRYKDYSNIGTNLKIYFNGEDKSGKGIRDTEKLLEEYLPDINSSLLGSVIILGQGLPQRFTNNTPSGRKEVLEKLSKSDFMIEDIKVKLSNRKQFLNNELRKYQDLILEEESKKSVYEKQLVNLLNEKENLIPEDFDSIISSLNNKINENESISNSLLTQISDKNLEITLNRDTYKNKEKEYEVSKSNLIKEFNLNLQPIIKEETDIQIQIKTLSQEITKLESIKDICPTCGQKLPDVHKVDTTNLRNKLNEYNVKFEEIKLRKKEQQEKDDLTFDETSNSYIKQLEELDTKYNSLYKDLSELNNKQFIVKSDIYNDKLELDKIKIRKDNYENKIKTIDKDLDEATNQINLLKDNLLYNNIEKDNIEARLNIVNKMLTIATRDFRGFLLSEVIKFINQKAKEYCKEIFDTEEIEFRLDGNNIFIGYCGKQYENLSGGEKQKIDLIIQFSIRDMLTKYLDFSSNILVLDEIFDNLDSIGCQKVLNLISNKLTDISSIYIITHHSDIDIPADNELIILKDENGISKVV